MVEPHNYKTVGISMILVAASLAIIGLIHLAIGEDVLFADKIQRAKTAEFQKCMENNDLTSPECQKYEDAVIYQICLDNKDLESPECYKYTMQVQSEIYEDCRANRDTTSPQCIEYGDKVLVGLLEQE